MNIRPCLLLSAVCLVLSGCTTIEEKRVLMQSASVQSQSNYYARDKVVVLEALVSVLQKMNYTVSRASPAQGIVEAYSNVLEGNDPGTSRQFFISARLRVVGQEETGVELSVREARDGDFKVGATSQSHAKHGRYDSIFEALEAALGGGSWLPPGPKDGSP